MTQEEFNIKYVDGPEAANILNVSTARIRRLCLDGRFEGVIKVGTSGWAIPREAVLSFMPQKRGRKSSKEKDTALLNAVLNENQ